MPVSYGTLRSDDLHTMGHLILAAPELSGYLAQFLQPGLRLAVTTPAGRLLARADAPGAGASLGSGPPLLARLYRRFVDRPGERQVIQSRAPIYDRDHQVLIGTLEVTQTADRWIRLRDRALTRMLNLTLVTSLVVVTAMFAFAAWLAVRLSRLRRASESALTRSGLVTSFPETQARDELGDVARSFATLLARLDEYTQYLRTLAGKLAHEIRTPLTIVRSSLDNLESEQVPACGARLPRPRPAGQRAPGRDRARHGSGHPGRGEHRQRRAGALRPGAGARLGGGRLPGGLPGASFPVRVRERNRGLYGCTGPHRADARQAHRQRGGFQPGRLADHRAAARGERWRCSSRCENPGPALPLHLEGRVFESLWQSRPGSDGQPHLGLGLYIVRLIAEFHGGEASARNLADGSGVRLSVRLPR